MLDPLGIDGFSEGDFDLAVGDDDRRFFVAKKCGGDRNNCVEHAHPVRAIETAGFDD
jgi:hypothetical protein